MIRERLHASLRDASAHGDSRSACLLRLVLAALKERDAAAREHGAPEGLDEREIEELLREMVAQRRDEAQRCENIARLDLAEQEADEIEVLERFLPPKLDARQMEVAVDDAIKECGASKLKDTGKVIQTLKQRYDGQVDVAKAKKQVCARLS